jgi:hypothetical protein
MRIDGIRPLNVAPAFIRLAPERAAVAPERFAVDRASATQNSVVSAASGKRAQNDRRRAGDLLTADEKSLHPGSTVATLTRARFPAVIVRFPPLIDISAADAPMPFFHWIAARALTTVSPPAIRPRGAI